jgi:hypothetical protein
MALHLKTLVRVVTGLFRQERASVARTPLRPVDAVIDVDEFVEAASTPEFARLTQRADGRVRDLGFVR